MRKPIKILLFDLGKTLLYPMDPWSEVFFEADIALGGALEQSGLSSSTPFIPGEFQSELEKYYTIRNIDHVETTAYQVLKDYLIKKGYSQLPESVLRSSLNMMYSVTQKNWVIEDDVINTLDTLMDQGYRLGLISNAADDIDVQQLIDSWKLRPYFEFIITSAVAGMRKPHPLMFQKALHYFLVEPAQVAMIGDTLNADIAGANALGIYSIWITRRVQLPVDGDIPFQPQAVISKIEQLPTLLQEINNQDSTD